MSPQEKQIVEQLRTGDNSAYKYIYDHHYVLLCKIAYGFLGDDYLAETVVSETIFHIYEIRQTLDIKTSLRSYLVGAVRNRCINFLNLEYQRRVAKFSDITDYEKWGYLVADKYEYPLGALLEKELETEIHKAIENLPDDARRVFKMSRLDDKTYKDIADELGISVNTVKYHIKNALARLTKELDKYLLVLLLWTFLC
jgi:RNA polymerase sigma-70 factor (ECF subfamily)